jgi:hypothetical protein
MAKISRKKNTEKVTDKETKKEHEINTSTGDVTPVADPKPEPWKQSKMQDFEKCKSLVRQITEKAMNIVDEKNITTIANNLACFAEAGRDLFTQVCLYQDVYDTATLNELFDKAIRTTKNKRPIHFYDICVKEYGLVMLLNNDNYEYYLMEGAKAVRYSDKLDDDQIVNIQEYGFVELRNQYYFAKFNYDSGTQFTKVTLESTTNYTVRVLYHIARGKGNKRVIALINNQNEKKILEVETKQLSSLQSFKALCEDQGYFVLKNAFKDDQLQRIKMKLFKEEKTSEQLEVLGWNNKHHFFAFCNGLYKINDKTFHAVDEFGIVTINNKHFHIPYHPGTDENFAQNEKLIFYAPGDNVTFKDWADLYFQAFGMVGATVLTFTVSTIFSDHIFNARPAKNFPMLFLYGEGGSGKGTMSENAQSLFGQAQPPLKISEKANTDKAKIRKFATFCNLPVRLEEFTNSIDPAAMMTIQNLFDRFGYERATTNSMYGTETVPVRSTVIILGNEYPGHDPFMQRVILLDADKNKHTDTELAAYRALQKLVMKGITTVLIEILNYREAIEKNWLKCYQDIYDNMRDECKEMDVPSRMIENYSVLLATYQCLHDVQFAWPYTFEQLKEYFKQALKNQAEKRSTGAVVQQFWDIVLNLCSKNQIHEGKQFLLDGNGLFIRFKELHALYLEEHLRMYRKPGMQAATLLQKLKISEAYVGEKSNKRFGKANTSAHEFAYDKLNIDLLFTVNQKRDHYELMNPANDKSKPEETEAEKKAKLQKADEIYQQSQQNKQPNIFDAPPPVPDEDIPF